MKLNRKAFEHAKKLVTRRAMVRDDRDAWSEHRPSAEKENEFIRENGIAEYAKWYLGVDEEKDVELKTRYKFPYGDFSKVHRCGVLTAESRAGQYKYFDIEKAAATLHALIDGVRHHPVPVARTRGRATHRAR